VATSALATILLLLAAGYACARLGVFAPDAADVLNRFVLYVCLPALILALLPGLRVRAEHLALVAIPWALLALSSAAVLAASRFFGFRRDVEGALLLCVGLGNTSFLGYPMVSALLGEDALRLAIVYDQFGSFLMLSTFGLVIQARYGGEGSPGAGAVLRRVVAFPPFVALVLAALVAPFGLPPAAVAALRRVGDALVPIAMFAVGLRIKLRPPPERGPFALGLLLKMGLLPLASWALALALRAPPEILRVAVFESAVPPMITAGALAMAAGLAPELAAALVGYGLLASMASLPLWAAVLPGPR